MLETTGAGAAVLVDVWPYSPPAPPDPDLPGATRVLEQVAALTALRNRVDAEILDLTADLVGLCPVEPDRGYRHTMAAEGELAPLLRVAPVTAGIMIDLAERVTSHLPGTLALHRRGVLDRVRVRVVEELTRHLDRDQCLALEAIVLPGAADQTPGELRRAVEHALARLGPGLAERRRRQGVKDRSVDHWSNPDGTGTIHARLSAEDAAEIDDLLDHLAHDRSGPDDTRHKAMRKADTLVELVLRRPPRLGPQDTDPVPPRPPDGPPPHDRDDPTSHGVRRWQDPGPDEPDDLDDRFGPDQPDQPARADSSAASGDDERAATGGDNGRGSDDPGPVEPVDLDERFEPEPAATRLERALRRHAITDPIRDEPLAHPGAPVPVDPRVPADVVDLLRRAAAWAPPVPWAVVNTTTDPDGHPIQVGETERHGPTSPEHARWLLHHGHARPPPAPVDPYATVPGHDPPARMADSVRARDRTCRYPGCLTRARRCDQDHATPHPDGPTRPANLTCLCRAHHRTKQLPGWQLRLDPDGTATWTTPAGYRYVTTPRGTTGRWTGAISLGRAPER